MAFNKNRLYSVGGNATNTVKSFIYYNSADDTVTATSYFAWDALSVGDQITVIGADYKSKKDYRVSAVASNKYTVIALVDGVLDVVADATALPITSRIITFDTTAEAFAMTLADGYDTQRLTMVMITDGGNNAVITPAHFANGSTLTFADALDTVELLFINDAWYVTSLEGVAVGA